jgi:hypothetical protein
MLEWIFNISIISLLIILIFHYGFQYFCSSKPQPNNLVDLKVQKYKTIIDTLTQECLKHKEKNDYATFSKMYEEDTGQPLSEPATDDLEELELYLNSKIE